MASQTIKPVLPVVKTKNTLQSKKKIEKSPRPDDKAVDNKEEKKKGGIDTYA